MIYELKEWSGGISSFSDRGIRGAFKMGKNLDIRKDVDTLTCGQALIEEGLFDTSHSSSPSTSQSSSLSPSSSASASMSFSNSSSASQSPSGSASKSASASPSPSGSGSPSSSISSSLSPSAGLNNIYVDLVLFWVKATDGIPMDSVMPEISIAVLLMDLQEMSIKFPEKSMVQLKNPQIQEKHIFSLLPELHFTKKNFPEHLIGAM